MGMKLEKVVPWGRNIDEYRAIFLLRMCREVRLFPLCGLDSRESELTKQVIEYFSRDFKTEILKTDYQFQKGADKMLKIQRF